MNLITASQLSLQLGTTKILNDVSLEIHPNEFVGLIGPNGAGKTSLLKIIAGIITPDSGSVELPLINSSLATTNVSSIKADSPLAKRDIRSRAKFMGYLAQSEKPAWPLSVENLVALGRIPHTNAGIEQVEKALRDTDTYQLKEKNLFELSGGELQRVLLARVFAGEPKVIVADEPIVALDIYHQLHVMELLAAHAQQGGAVIAALHDLSLAARFCSRLILLDHGKLIADGAPAQVLTPENLERVYKVKTYVECRDDTVMILARDRIVDTAKD